MAEAHQGVRHGLQGQSVANPPSIPTPEHANYLIHWYMLTTNCLLNVTDQQELARGMPDWLGQSKAEIDEASAVYFLILALGAQSCPEDRDESAESYFNYGRYVTSMTLMEDPNLVMIQAHVLMTMYLLAGSRRNSAFMYLGTAVRAAYALGLHRSDISALYPPSECSTRERLWRAIRILDLFMSASLGRPPSTTETRDTTAQDNYSASNDLCFIFESIVNTIYAKHMASSYALAWISQLHRGWASRFTDGLKTDGIPCSDQLQTERGEVPNLGLIQLKGAYYWTIMLLTQPVLIEKVSLYASAAAQSDPSSLATSSSASNDVLATACVNSAIRTIDLLAAFVQSKHVPKRLPLIVNSAFMSALVLGLAVFGDLDQTFPLHHSMDDARMVLAKFSPHDTVANGHLVIVDNFKRACDKYVEIRTRRNMDRQRVWIGALFGTVHVETPFDSQSYSHTSNNNRPTPGHEYSNNSGSSSGRSPSKTADPGPVTEHHTVLAEAVDNNYYTGDNGFLSHAPNPAEYLDTDANIHMNSIIPALSPRMISFDYYNLGSPIASRMVVDVLEPKSTHANVNNMQTVGG